MLCALFRHRRSGHGVLGSPACQASQSELRELELDIKLELGKRKCH